jgi:hypothetical protein
VFTLRALEVALDVTGRLARVRTWQVPEACVLPVFRGVQAGAAGISIVIC